MKRRSVLKAGLVLVATSAAAAIYRPAGAALRVLNGGSKWITRETLPPVPVDPTKRMFLSDKEMAQITAIFDRLIPSDEVSVGASEAGCVVFLDNQLAGPYGKGSWRYLVGPEQKGSEAQGDQSLMGPADLYRKGLAELDAFAQEHLSGTVEGLPAEQLDDLLEKMESGQIKLASVGCDVLFRQMLANVQEGYFADPVYGGNKDMVGWKMIGFPGSRYDYRDYVELRGQKLNIIPVSIVGRV
jgi:gluconate 2-dehydrogenase gamma chain